MPTRTCLVTAPTATDFRFDEELASEQVQHASNEPSLGVLSLAAVLERGGQTPSILNLNELYFAESGAADFVYKAARQLAEQNADVYGFSSICSSYPVTLRICRELAALRPGTPILLGGPQASVVDVATLEAFPCVQGILRGEAELTLPLLIAELGGSGRFSSVPGLTWRRGSQVVRNGNAPVIEDLDALPLPAYHLTRDLDRSAVACLEMGRGCPFACEFCSTNDFFRRRFRLRSPRRIIADMRVLAARWPQRHFNLVHDMFTVDRKRVAEFCQAMIAAETGFTWSCSARTDCIDEELLQLMAAAGCTGIFYGIESGSARMQKAMNKGLDIAESRRMIEATARCGIRNTVSLITGFPEETWDDVNDTLDVFSFSLRFPTASPQLFLLAPLADTPLHQKYRHELQLGALTNGSSHQGREQDPVDRELVENHPDLFPNFYYVPTRWLDRETLEELHEFLLMAPVRVQWLLVALCGCTSGLLEVFRHWREHRKQLRPGLSGGNLRHYYRQRTTFGADFISLVKASWQSEAVSATSAYYEGLLLPGPTPPPQAPPAALPLRPADRPQRLPDVHVVELAWNMEAVIASLSRKDDSLAGARQQCFYVSRPVSRENCRLIEIPVASAKLMGWSDGSRTIRDIVGLYRASFTPPSGVDPEQYCTALLAAFSTMGYLHISRDPAGSHSGADCPSKPGGNAVQPIAPEQSESTLLLR